MSMTPLRKGSITQYVVPKEWENGLPPEKWLAERTYVDKKPLAALISPRWALDPQRQAVLLALYGEVCGGWRTLTDVRFKLLGLLPVVSLAAITTLVSSSRGQYPLSALEISAIAVLALLFTCAVRLYDLRNTMLYSDLVGRGRQIEAELGIHTGHFRGRPDSKGVIQHDTAINAVYNLATLAWALAALQPWVDTLRR